MDWTELILAIGSLAISIFVYVKNHNNTKAINTLKQSIKMNKLYVICPKCSTKIELTSENVKEESSEEDINV